MGSVIELNDTLQLTAEQGFPAELSLEQYSPDEMKVAHRLIDGRPEKLFK